MSATEYISSAFVFPRGEMGLAFGITGISGAWALVLAIAGKRMGVVATRVSVLLAAGIFILASYLLSGVLNMQAPAAVVFRADWLRILPQENEVHAPLFSLRLDETGAWMLWIVAAVSLLVHIYSSAYMSGEKNRNRYFAFLSFFIFAMTGLVLSGNLMLMFFFWELVGLGSWLLIGFWHQAQEPARASFKAMVMNRLADAAFLAGILILLSISGSTEFSELFSAREYFRMRDAGLMDLAGLLIFAGCVGKSAQFPLQTWLPDAMAGPTPASAMIHAATMVASGVFLLIRVSPLFSATVSVVILVTGLITALLAALSAATQWDFKRILAWSTVSQLGLMVAAAGTGETGAAFFHLATHAFFKAGLFLFAGIMIHLLHAHDTATHSQDIRDLGRMKGLPMKVVIPFFLLAAALAGIPLSSGFLSKEALLSAFVQYAQLHGGLFWLLPALAFITSALTAFYLVRMTVFLFFRNPSRPISVHHRPGWRLTVPVMLTAVFSLWIFWDVAHPLTGDHSPVRSAVTQTIEHPHSNAFIVPALSLLMLLCGAGCAVWMFWKYPDTPHPEGKWTGWMAEHFGLDRLYRRLWADPFQWISRTAAQWDKQGWDAGINALLNRVFGWRYSLSSLLNLLDRKGVDALVNGVADTAISTARRMKAVQPASLQRLILLSLLGFLVLVIALIYFARF